MTDAINLSGRDGVSRILIGESFDRLPNHLNNRPAAIVTDRTVRRLHGERFPGGVPVIVLPKGERRKDLRAVELLYRRFLSLDMDRSSLVVGVGGGIVCDIAGFAASTFMRGVAFAFVPTTLLAQVDAAVGGKNGVNFLGYKNMVGVIRQPAFILCDPTFLATLPKEELLNGFAEIVKAGAIADPDLFAFLENEHHLLRTLNKEALSWVIRSAIRIKTAVVERDEQEKGERRKLNFGHTFGHALEAVCGISHGRAVSIGMAIAGRISRRKKRIDPKEAERLENALKRFDLPVEFGFNPGAILDKIRKDKKKNKKRIHFVLLRAIGEAVVEDLDFAELEEHIHDLC